MDPYDPKNPIVHQAVLENVGPITINVLLSAFLFGVLTLQVYIFFNYHRDSTPLRTLIATTWLLDGLHLVFCCMALYENMVLKFGNIQAQMKNTLWSYKAANYLVAITIFLAQSCFAFRAWRSQRTSNVLGMLIAVFSVTQTVAGLYVAQLWTRYPFFSQFYTERASKVSGTVWCGCGVGCSLFIMVYLVRILRDPKSGLVRVHLITSKAMRLLVNTGFVLVVWSIAGLILFVIQNNFINVIFNVSVAKLYSNTLLAVLNARKSSIIHDIDSNIIDSEFNAVQLQALSTTTGSGSGTGGLSSTNNTASGIAAGTGTTSVIARSGRMSGGGTRSFGRPASPVTSRASSMRLSFLGSQLGSRVSQLGSRGSRTKAPATTLSNSFGILSADKAVPPKAETLGSDPGQYPETALFDVISPHSKPNYLAPSSRGTSINDHDADV